MSDICLAVLQVRPPQQILKFLLFPTKSCFASFRGDPEIRENRSGGCKDKCTEYAAVAHLVERHLAKVEVASSSLVGRSIKEQQQLLQYGPVAQLVRAPACHAGGRRFEPDPGRSSECQSFVWQSYK